MTIRGKSSIHRLAPDGRTVLVTLGFLLVTAWYTYPQFRAMEQVPPHHDVYFSIWRLQWVAHQLVREPLKLFDANIFFPAPRTLAYSDATLFQGLLALPLIWLGMSPPVSYNALVLLSFVLSAAGMFLLVRSLTDSVGAGIIAGTIYGFAPFRLDHYMHLELLWGVWVPFTWWALHRTLETRSVRYGVATGVFVAFQVFSCVYYAVFLATLLPVLTYALFIFRRPLISGRAIAALATGVVVGFAIVLPYAVTYAMASKDVGNRSLTDVIIYSARVANYLASPLQSTWYGWTFEPWGGTEKQLFPGFVAICLATTALAQRQRLPEVLSYAAVLVLAGDLSLGANGYTFMALRSVVPVYGGLRVPARAAMLVLAALAVLAGYGVERLLRIGRTGRWSPVGGYALVGALFIGIAVEYSHAPIALEPVPTRGRQLERWLRAQPRSPVLHLPLPRADRLPGREAEFQYASMFHWQPLLNGHSGFYPGAYFELLDRMGGFPDDGSVGLLRDLGVRFIVVQEDFYRAANHRALFLGPDLEQLTAALGQRADMIHVASLGSALGIVRVYALTHID